ncbi:putative helicase [Calothrix sp. NIES-2100]|uniref:hypothetical protein n=1 Tax=Calothrix sp. NIES-2100 TaxID=1954172 RepID=UPI000B5EFC6B|nr:putative helicase [Calothrix sp. NIES-2100]
MYDLVTAYQRLDCIYQLYIKSAFPLHYRALAEERGSLALPAAVGKLTRSCG